MADDAIRDRVNVTVSSAVVPTTRKGFGTGMLTGAHTETEERSRVYTSAAGVATDFGSGSHIHNAAVDYFAQSPQPENLRIGRRLVDSVIIALIPNDVPLNETHYIVTINGTDFDFLSDADATKDEILGGLATLIDAGSEPVSTIWSPGGPLLVQGDGSPAAVDGFSLKVSSDLKRSTYWFDVTVDAVQNDTDYTIRIFNQELTFTSDATATADEISAGLVALINAAFDIDTELNATDESGSFGLLFYDQSTNIEILDPTLLGLTENQSSETWSAAFDAIDLDNNDWIATDITDGSPTVQETVADDFEARTKLFGFATSQPEIASATAGNLFALLQAKTLRHSFGLFHSSEAGNVDGASWPAMAWMGKRLTIDLDVRDSPWFDVSLGGIPVDVLSPTQRQNIIGTSSDVQSGLNGNIYTEVGGANRVERGLVFAGEWIDAILSDLWLQSRMTEDLSAQQIIVAESQSKIPFTDEGIAMIEGVIRTRVGIGIAVDHYFFDVAKNATFGYGMTIPTRAGTTDVERQNRKLTGFLVQLSRSGAVHSVDVAITVQV